MSIFSIFLSVGTVDRWPDCVFFLCPRSSVVGCLLICWLYKIEYVETLNLLSMLFLHQHFVLGCVFVSRIHGYADTQKTVQSFFLFAAAPLEGINLGLSNVKNLNFRGYIKFCTRPTTCRKKSNMSICRQALDLSICRSVDSTDNIQQIWLSGTQNLICRSVDMSTDCWSVDLLTVPTDKKKN